MNRLIPLLLATLSYSLSAGLVFDLRKGKGSWEIVETRGVDVYIAPEVFNRVGRLSHPPTPARQKIMSCISRVLKNTEIVMPRTFFEFKKRGFKIYLLQEPNSGNGLEFIRPNQHKWDRRIPRAGGMSKSIFILRTIDFCDTPPFDTFYFVHEMAHFKHLVLESWRASEIKGAYSRAVKTGEKFKGMYAGSNHLEYFADASATYLLPRQLIPRPGPFPKGANALKFYCPESYKMCENFWGSKKTENKPDRKPPTKVDDIPRFAAARPPKNIEITKMCLEVDNLIKWGEHYEELTRSTGWPSYRQKAIDTYSVAYGKIINFERDFSDEQLREKKLLLEKKLNWTN